MSTAKAEKIALFFPHKGVLKTNRTMIKSNNLISVYNQNSSSGIEFSWGANKFLHNIKN